MEAGASPLAQLSEEELCIICRFLGPKDVARLGAASKDLAAAVFCDEVWHGLLQRAGGPPSRAALRGRSRRWARRCGSGWAPAAGGQAT